MPTLVNYLPFTNFRYYSVGPRAKSSPSSSSRARSRSARTGSSRSPRKPTADIIVDAIARAPGGKPLPAWDPRLPKGSTYDQVWLDTIWPNWPANYDFAYHNSSHPDLICPRHLAAGDRVTLDNLVADTPRLTLAIPSLQPMAGLLRTDGSASRRAMVLDTLFLDIAARRRDARAFLSWRANFEPGQFKSAVLIARRDLDEMQAMQRSAA